METFTIHNVPSPMTATDTRTREPATPGSDNLQVQPGMVYTCQNSAVCCRTFETIPLDPRAAANIESAAFQREFQPADKTSPGLSSHQSHLARTACGDCVMLTGDHLCAIHSILGAEAKPQVCQDFPFRYVETPGGTFVGLSFVCPSVRGQVGDLLSEQAAYLDHHHAKAQSRHATPASVPLDARLSLRWEDYIVLESLLAEVMMIRSRSLRHRLAAMGVLINLLPRFAVEIDPTLIGSSAAFIPRDLMDGMATTLRNEQFESLFRIAAKPIKGAGRTRRMFLGMFVAFANRLQHSTGRIGVIAGVLGQYVRHASGLGRVKLNPVGSKLSHSDLGRAKVPENGEPAEMISRYVIHCLFRKDLLLGTGLARRLRLLLLNTSLIPWYAAAEAKAAGCTQPAPQDYSEAIAHVEKLYGFHSQFYSFFERNAWFDDVVEAFLLKPNFPMIMMS
jgi:Fe-S-cluster containining protein